MYHILLIHLPLHVRVVLLTLVCIHIKFKWNHMVPDSEHSANCVRDGINESDTVLGIVLSDYAGVNSQKKNGAENGLRETMWSL